MQCFIGSVVLFGGNFAPRGWMLCQGQVLNIAQQSALFSILGTTYGGNGQTTFGLPDLQGRAVVSAGQRPGAGSYPLGQKAGVENTTLITMQMPTHTHLVSMRVKPGSSSTSGSASPANAVYAPDGGGNTAFSPTANNNLAPYSAVLTVGFTGNNLPFNNRNPFLVINHIICIEGVFPSRN